uniref:Ileal sodium/bile acid cotransporter n=1 Tax=Plectus sambesii TaxID=2011161 RepID=A0A914X4M7_9BILA
MRAVKKPVGCAIGFGCQYILMPMIAYATALVVLSGYPSLQFGFFAVGCSPGGGQSNMYTILLGGNIDLSVTMTFFSTAAALGMMPLWITLVGQSFYTYSEEIKIPFYMIFSGLAGLIVPSAFGMLLIHYKPDWAKTCKTIVKILSLLMVAVFTWFGLYVNRYVFFLMTWYTLLAGMLLPWCGYVFAFAIATILRQDYKDSITISIETGIQNAGISIILCQFALPQPDADMTVVMPLCVMIFSSLPFLAIILYRRIRRCFCPREKDGAVIVESGETDIELERKRSSDSPQILTVFEKPVDVSDESERRFSLTLS